MASYDDSGFSQSRGDDDLFDDDFIPLEPSEQQAYSKLTELDQSTQQIHNLSSAESQRPSPPNQLRGNVRGRAAPRGNTRARGRVARDRGGGTTPTAHSSLQQSKYAPSPTGPIAASTQSQDLHKPTEVQTPAPPEISPTPPEQSATPPPADSSSAPTAPSTSTPPTTTQSSRPPAVRGDRTLTGGPQRTKLTEAELTQKMAEAKARSQALSTAHARAEADAASFAERERAAQQKRERDRINRKVLEGEREKNRERKMKALGGREWDAQKEVAETIGKGTKGRGRFMRGAYGGIRHDGRDSENGNSAAGDELIGDLERGRGRSRGSRGRGRGRANGRGRGDGHDRSRTNGPPLPPTNSTAQPDVSAEADFPSLPPGEKPTTRETKSPKSNTNASGPVQATKLSKKAAETPISPSVEGSWADQVDRVEAARAS